VSAPSSARPDTLERDAPAASAAASPPLTRVAVLGASGYSGQEFVRLALAHPALRLAALVSRAHAGRPAAEWLPGLDERAAALPPAIGTEALVSLLESDAVDAIVACLPHGVWAELAPGLTLGSRAVRVIDLSSDFRDGRDGYAYGLPELFRGELGAAPRIANPGCYPTAAALALAPAAPWLAGPVMVTALSGVSGAGRSAQLRTSFVELHDGAAVYRAGSGHAHVPEMERTLARIGAAQPIGFVPQLVPMSRGILLTATAPLARAISPAEAHAAYVARYAGEPFVRVLPPGEWPDTRQVRGSNRCDLAVTTLHGGRTLLATGALDNLVKGAAGQALQNLNLLLGLPETTGLPRHGSPW